MPAKRQTEAEKKAAEQERQRQRVRNWQRDVKDDMKDMPAQWYSLFVKPKLDEQCQ